MSERRRDFIGEYRGLAERTRVFRTSEGLEIDTSDHYEIRRRRVFYDEVLLVSLHRGLSGGYYPLVFVLFALSTSIGLPIVETQPGDGIIVGLIIFFLLAAVAAFFIPAWTVTVYGKRTRTRMRYRFRQARAQEIYDEICQAAAMAQRQLAERQRVQVPPPVPEPLLALEMPASLEPSPPAPLPPAGEG